MRVAEIGTDLSYARRVELGFTDRDKLGRNYHQPAKPYLRPALDTNGDRAISEVSKALWAIIEKYGR